MGEYLLSGRGFVDQVSYMPLRLKVVTVGDASVLDAAAPKRYLNLGWLAGFESMTDGNNLEQARYIGPLYWIMFDHQSIDWRVYFDGGGYDGIAYGLMANVSVYVFF